MAVMTAAEALEVFIDELGEWVAGPRAVRSRNAHVIALTSLSITLTSTSAESDFQRVVDAFQNLRGHESLFQSRTPLSYMLVKSISAAHCARELAGGNILTGETVSTFDAENVEFDLEGVSSYASGKSAVPEESFCYVNMDSFDVGAFHRELANVSTNFYFRLVGSRYRKRKGLCRAVFLDNNVKKSSAKIEALSKFALVRDGRAFHSPKVYTGTSYIKNSLFVNPSNSIEQFEDILHVLSEANVCVGVLDKYLRLYQVLENFMVRRGIVGIQAASVSSVLTVRSLRILYRSVEETELASLEELIKRAFEVITTPIGAHSLKAHIAGRWSPAIGMPGGAQDAEASLLKVYGTYPNSGPGFNAVAFGRRLGAVSAGDSAQALAAIIYRFRNAIVHNKEHEFHLTYISLNRSIFDVLNMFLIPAMEDLIFALMLANTDLVWYRNASIRLYVD